MVNAELKDLFKATKIYCIIINRLGYNKKDYYKMLDAKEEAIYTIESYDKELGLTKSMYEFLINRVNRTVKECNNGR